MKSIVFALLFFVANLSFSQSLIPAPIKMERKDGAFSILANTPMIVSKNKDAQIAAQYLINQFKRSSGMQLVMAENSPSGIFLQINPKENPQLGNEGYTLDVSTSKIVLQANTGTGLFYGVQTLLQLLPKEIESKTPREGVEWKVPSVTIMDYPRFGWRGLMLDVSRHFFSKEYVKEYIDHMARYKFNRLHWHLTDDNGWRVEIKSLPKLTEVGAWRVPRTGTFNSNTPPQPGEKPTDGGFYTQDDIKEIVQYAKDRFIEILPEVDVPGHSMAALASYPQLSVSRDTSVKVNPGTKFSTWFGNGKFEMHIDNTLNPIDENVYQFLDKVFSEIAVMFPFEYIHMGGDECYKGYWERDAKVQEFMKKNNIKNGEELQAYFNKRVNKIINSKKKKMIGWDEILEGGLAPGAAVMSWRGVKGGIEATHQKHPVVMSPSPQFYLDFMQGDASIEAPVYSTTRLKDIYSFDIIAEGMDSTLVLGGQGNLWTEQIPTTAQVEYMTYPRAFAIVEGLWTGKSKKNWNDFVTRVESHFERFDAAQINYSPSIYDPIISVKKNTEGKITIELYAEAQGIDFYYTVDNSIPNQYHNRYTNMIVLPDDADYFKVISYRNGKPLGRLINLKTEDLVKRVRK